MSIKTHSCSPGNLIQARGRDWVVLPAEEDNVVKLRPVDGSGEEAKILIEQWRQEYNQVRPHSAKNYRPPAPETILTMATT
jgi:transposase InsO family protein